MMLASCISAIPIGRTWAVAETTDMVRRYGDRLVAMLQTISPGRKEQPIPGFRYCENPYVGAELPCEQIVSVLSGDCSILVYPNTVLALFRDVVVFFSIDAGGTVPYTT